MSPLSPPRVASIILRLFLGAEAHEIIAGDLEQEFAERVENGMLARKALRWFRNQVAASVAYRQAARLRHHLSRALTGGGTTMTLPSRFAVGCAVLVVLLLDFAALDDITTGNQPHFYPEYTMLAISALLFAALGWRLVRERRASEREPSKR